MLTNLFYTVNFSILIVASLIGLTFCFLTIFIVINNRKLHTVTNLLTCNTCVAASFYFIMSLIGVVFGLRDNWIFYQPACAFRAYCVLVSCAAICYSISIQAISRLFHAVFYKHKYLLTWRTHKILIILSWFISIIVSIEPFFVHNGFALVTEIRICTTSAKVFPASIFSIIIIYIISLNTVGITYGIIFYHVRQSTRRVTAFVANINVNNGTNPNNYIPNTVRDMKIIQHILIQTNMLLFGGTPYLILVLWNLIQPQSSPESLNFVNSNSITICTTLMIIYTFYMNKNIRNVMFQYLFR